MSQKKEWIPKVLRKNIQREEVIYYVLKNKFSTDLHNLKDIVNKYDGHVTIIGHSTGGFLALTLLRECFNVVSIHCINPAFNLTYSLDKNNRASDFLKERNFIESVMNKNLLFFKIPSPVCVYQGLLDDQVDIDYNEKIVISVTGHIYKYQELGHRFDEDKFEIIVKDISKYVI